MTILLCLVLWYFIGFLLTLFMRAIGLPNLSHNSSHSYFYFGSNPQSFCDCSIRGYMYEHDLYLDTRKDIEEAISRTKKICPGRKVGGRRPLSLIEWLLSSTLWPWIAVLITSWTLIVIFINLFKGLSILYYILHKAFNVLSEIKF